MFTFWRLWFADWFIKLTFDSVRLLPKTAKLVSGSGRDVNKLIFALNLLVEYYNCVTVHVFYHVYDFKCFSENWCLNSERTPRCIPGCRLLPIENAISFSIRATGNIFENQTSFLWIFKQK